MADFIFNIKDREYNQVSNITKSVKLNDGQSLYDLGDFKEIDGKTIIGISIARSSDNSTEQIKDKDNNQIVNDKALLSSFITLKNSSSSAVIQDLPIRTLAFSTYRHRIGTFAQLLMADFAAYKSYICFANASDIDEGTVMEITFWLSQAANCDVVVQGCS